MTSGRGILFRDFMKIYNFSSAKIEERLQFHHIMADGCRQAEKNPRGRIMISSSGEHKGLTRYIL
jgi:hypothetical protein